MRLCVNDGFKNFRVITYWIIGTESFPHRITNSVRNKV